MKGTNLGEFEELVLLIVCLLIDRAYGVSVLDEIRLQTSREVSISTVHAALYRLEKKGYLRSRLEAGEGHRGNRPRRYFQATDAGKQAVREARRIRLHLWNLIPDLTLR